MCVGQVQLLGGWFERSADSEEVQEAVRSAMDDFNKKSKARKYFKLINVTSAETQVRVHGGVCACVLLLYVQSVNGVGREEGDCVGACVSVPRSEEHTAELQSR